MEGVERARQLLSMCPDAPFDAVAWAIGAFHQRRASYAQKLITSASELYKKRHSSQRQEAMRRYLGVYSEAAQQHGQRKPFEPVSLRVRCLLWSLAEMRRLEEKLIRHCALHIQYSGLWVPPDAQPPRTSLFHKLFSIPHIPLVVLWRCTFDLFDDVRQTVSNELWPDGPPVKTAALFSVLVGSESLSFDRTLDGDCSRCYFGPLRLDDYLNEALKLRNDVLKDWTARHRDHLEIFVALATMETE